MRLNTWYEAGLSVGVVLLAACGGETLEPLPAKFQAVSAGGIHSCGIVTDGAAYCWGRNEEGQLGDGSRRSRVYPVPVVGTVRYQALSPGAGHTCGIATTGAAYCWGLNFNGQLGDGTNADRSTPAPVDGGNSWIALSAGGAYTCGIATDSLAYCWGWNAVGQLGDGTDIDRASPTAVSGGLKFQAISTNAYHTCGLTVGGDVYCWGSNEYGELGTGNTDDSLVPVLVSGGMTWVAVSVGFSHGCGIATDGSGHCWGRNHYGQLGIGDTLGGLSQLSPFLVKGGISWGSVELGAYFSCGTAAQAAGAYCWGYNGSGQLGVDLPSSNCTEEGGAPSQCSLEPAAISGGLTFTTVSAHTQHACGLAADGFAYCWGSGSEGQLGTGEKGNQVFTITPLRVAGQP